ncbi:TetR family transcriptional regulator [Actinocorallia sp. API 0066]|uniref:TetR/AcrR family transcriptional regulator n=1 Tax=Actinocorallia sp. API 0066 TaxID=2896846 RepID=UPI001E502067|nr:TetR/AcrR family transcriptional regulator [Actinocorallia sp. API 0066]MCD0449947.1 TetR family transcriptional regulator [Actinocorallia sp. API 0066]
MSTDSGRTAILRAARRAFASRSYATVTLRGIAADAGVSAALIVKHFGGKEQLFEAVADFTADLDTLLAAPLPDLGRHLVETAVMVRHREEPPPLLRVIFGIAAGDERALLVGRFRDQALARLTALLPGPDAALRAELVWAHFLGLSTMLAIQKDGAAMAADPAVVVARYAPSLQTLIDG